MPEVDVVDDTFLRAPRSDVRGRTGGRWTSWLPDLSLEVSQDRGDEGVRWHARTASAPPLTGSAEVWLEQVPGGTVAHLYVRLDPAPASPPGRGGGPGRRARHLPDRVRRTWKRGLHAWKDSQEGDGSR